MIAISALKLNMKRKSFYSQWGEDGALEYILKKLPENDSHLVEFGAWDGKHLSNGFHFLEKHAYTGVLIEMDSDRFVDLKKNMFGYKASCIQAMVGYEGNSRLDHILSGTNIPRNFDLLSIDIDGNDYQVWDALKEYRPKVVIIEINASVFPGAIEINNPDKSFELFVSGSSISALTRLANSKGYRLIQNVGCNAIFVDNIYYSLFHKKDQSEFDLFTYEAFGRSQLYLQPKFQATVFRIFRPRPINRTVNYLKRLVLR